MSGPYRRVSGRILVRVALVAVAVLLVGCDPAEEVAETTVPVTGELAKLGQPPELTSLVADGRGERPVGLVIEDLIAGDGTPARSGDRITAHVGVVTWSEARVVSASWDRGQPLTVSLGEGTLIEGLEQGVLGMRVGSRRVLTMPPELAYGDRGVGDSIGPDEPLVLLVDLLLVESVVDGRP